MASFKSQIEDIAGAIDVGCDAEQFLIDGVKDIIHRIKRIDKEKIFLFTKESTMNSDVALSHQDDSVVSVTRIASDTKTYICLQVPPALYPKLFDDESEMYASAYNPKYYILNGELQIAPNCDATETGAVHRIVYAKPDDWENDDELDETFPEGLKYLIVLYASMMVIHNKIVNVYAGMPENITLPVMPVSPVLTEVAEVLPTYVSPSAFIITSPPSNAAIDLSDEIASQPEWQSPIMDNLPNLTLNEDLVIAPMSDTVVLPPAPELPDFSDGALDFTTMVRSKVPQYVAPTEVWNFSSVDSEFTNANSSLLTASNRITDAKNLVDTTEDLYKEGKAVLDTITGTYDASTDTYADDGLINSFKEFLDGDGSDLDSVKDLLEQLGDVVRHADILDGTDGYLKKAKEAYDKLAAIFDEAKKQSESQEGYLNALMGRTDDSTVSNFSWVGETTGTASNLGKMEDLFADYFDTNNSGNVISFIQSQEDVEMSTAVNQALGSLIQESAQIITKVQTELTGIKEFQSVGQSYMANAQGYAQEIQGAVGALQGHMASGKSIMDELQARIAVFQGHLVECEARYKNAEQILNQVRTRGEIAAGYLSVAQQYISRAAGFNAIVSGKIAKENARTQKFSATVQSSIADFNRDVAEYQAEIKKAEMDSGALLKSEQVKAQSEIQVYTAKVNEYQIKVNKMVTEWQASSVQAVIEEFKTVNANKIQKYAADVDKVLKSQNARLAVSTADYKSQFDKWAKNIDRKIAVFQAESGFDMTKYQAKTQADIQVYKNNLVKSMQSFEAGIKKYQADLARVAEINQSRIQSFSTEVQAYQVETAADVQNYGQELQKNTQKAQTLQAQYSALLQRYMEAFQQAKMDVAEQQQQRR